MTQMYDMFYDAAASNEKTGARSTSKWTVTGTFGEATASNAGIGWDTSPTMGMCYAHAQQARWQCPRAARELIPRSGAHPSPPPAGKTLGVARGLGGTNRPSATACRTRSHRSPTTCPAAPPQDAQAGRGGLQEEVKRSVPSWNASLHRAPGRVGRARHLPKRLGRSPARGDRHGPLPRQNEGNVASACRCGREAALRRPVRAPRVECCVDMQQ